MAFKISDGQGAFANGALQLVGGLLAGAGQGKMSDKDRQFQQQRDQNQAQSDFFNNQQALDFNRSNAALGASQMDPLAQQKARANFALQGDMMNQWKPTTAAFNPSTGMGSFSGGMGSMTPSSFTKGLFAPDAMANAEYNDFRMPLAHVAPSVPTPDLSQVGLPNSPSYNAVELARKGVFDQQEQERRLEKDRIARMWGEQEAAQQGGGSSLWKKLAKIGLIAGGGIATAMTGGAASPLLLGAIGAGTGAASGALDGGWKGALAGGALGGLTGGFGGGAAADGVKQGLGQAVKSTLTNPGTLLKMGGAATPGAAGQAMGVAGSFLPGPGATSKLAQDAQQMVGRVQGSGVDASGQLAQKLAAAFSGTVHGLPANRPGVGPQFPNSKAQVRF